MKEDMKTGRGGKVEGRGRRRSTREGLGREAIWFKKWRGNQIERFLILVEPPILPSLQEQIKKWIFSIITHCGIVLLHSAPILITYASP